MIIQQKLQDNITNIYAVKHSILGQIYKEEEMIIQQINIISTNSNTNLFNKLWLGVNKCNCINFGLV
jgi:hypothetical protein